jgi:hypothetical protein
VREEQPALREQRVDERLAERSFRGPAEGGAWHQVDVHVRAVRVQRDVRRIDLPVVDRHEHEVDVGLRPHRVVRQAAAQDGGEDRTVFLHLRDERVERGGEPLLDCEVVHRQVPNPDQCNR